MMNGNIFAHDELYFWTCWTENVKISESAVPYQHRCSLTLLAQYLMSMTEENCSYFKNMHKTHLLDENNILPSCEIEMP